MPTRTINLHSESKKWLRKMRSKLTYEQERMFRDHPGLLAEAVLDSYKQFCAGQGIDYTTTSIHQAELEFRQFQAQLQACRKKWAYLDTDLGIELFNMATHNVKERKMISLPNFYALWEYCRPEPSEFEAFMEMYIFGDKPSPELSKKKVSDYILLYNYYKQFYSLEAFERLSYKEQMLFYARHIAVRLTEEQEQFVSQFVDEYDSLPLFYLIQAFYKNTEHKSIFAIDIPPRFWDLYKELFDDIVLLTADNCHYEQIKKAERLDMDVNGFMKVLKYRLPWIHWVWSVKRGDNRYWGVSEKLYYRFRFHQLFNDIRQEQIRKERPEAVTFDLNRVCKNKKYYLDSNETEQTSEELAMIISVIKPILKEMLGIETKGNKIIFPAKRKRTL